MCVCVCVFMYIEVFVTACFSRHVAQAFSEAGVPWVIAVHSKSRVMDDACKIFAKHLYAAICRRIFLYVFFLSSLLFQFYFYFFCA